MTAAAIAEFHLRPEGPDEATGVRAVTLAAFDDPLVAGLPEALRTHPLGDQAISLVAVADDGEPGALIGHVGLSRCWIDDERRLVAGLTLSPLSVIPAWQRRGVGRALVAEALRAADAAGAPFVMLEGDPARYAPWGFEPAAAHGLIPPSVRIPAPACQVATLSSWDPSVRGALVYNDVFWSHDAVGLRDEALKQVRQALGVPGPRRT